MGEITKRKTGYAALHVAGIAKASRASVRASFNRAGLALMGHEVDGLSVPWHTRPASTLRQMRDTLAEDVTEGTYAPSTANASLAAIRGALRAAWIGGDLDRDKLDRARVALKKIKGNSAPGRALTLDQVRRMFEAAAKAPRETTRARDAVILALLMGAGLRRAELSGLDISALDTEGWTLTVRGKGNRVRVAHLTNGTRDAVSAWIDVRGTEPGPLVRGVTKGGVVRDGGMSGTAIAARVRRLAHLAHVPEVGPHALRRTFGTGLLAAGNDLAVVSRLMGHADVSTTAIYDRRGEEAERAALDTLAVPYVAPTPREEG